MDTLYRPTYQSFDNFYPLWYHDNLMNVFSGRHNNYHTDRIRQLIPTWCHIDHTISLWDGLRLNLYYANNHIVLCSNTMTYLSDQRGKWSYWDQTFGSWQLDFVPVKYYVPLYCASQILYPLNLVPVKSQSLPLHPVPVKLTSHNRLCA